VGFFSTEKMTYFSSIGAITIEKECRKGDKIPPEPVVSNEVETDNSQMILIIVIGLSVILVVVVVIIVVYCAGSKVTKAQK
jgi:hypothetical protein